MCTCKCVWWMVLEWNVFEDGACSIGFDLYSSQHRRKAFANMCMGRGEGRKCLVRVSSIASTGNCPSSCLYTLSDLNVLLFILGPFLPQIIWHTACKVPCNSKKTSNHMNECENLAFMCFHASTNGVERPVFTRPACTIKRRR